MESITVKYDAGDFEALKSVFGNVDENIKYLSSHFNVGIGHGADGFNITGLSGDVDKTVEVLNAVAGLSKRGEVTRGDMKILAALSEEGRLGELERLFDAVAVTAKGRSIRCKTPGQRLYVESILKNDICFGIGPAGTGKTYLAVALAVKAYKSKLVERIVLTRPAVEAGEKLGFLPGDLQEKVDPYLRPLYDALIEMFGLETYQRHLERGIIEVAPLAYMRGRTLSNAFIILDEAQNATKEQMKMFLTRMGERSKVIVTGDVTQTDLPRDKAGLINALEILDGIDGIGIARLTHRDVVRHELVAAIIRAYEEKSG